MKLLILACFIAAAIAGSLRSYGLPSFGPGGSGISDSSEDDCADGEIRHVDGNCVTPLVTRNLYLYNAPPVDPIVGPQPIVPPPRIEHTILFISNPEASPGLEPIVVPPPQTNYALYVLNKRPELEQKVLHVPAPEQQTPQVYFVNYAEGENPTLPTGDDLQSALSSASYGSGEVISTASDTAGDIEIDIIEGIASSENSIGSNTGNGFGGDIASGIGEGVSSDSGIDVPTPSGLYSPP
ncbi:uncharacterized protein [Cherax quadricarinatus]|uniref:uncharacterized protein n=1 Tax=Cherax quadricarinatus TaxID=27406 RepID=UPI00387E2EBD